MVYYIYEDQFTHNVLECISKQRKRELLPGGEREWGVRGERSRCSGEG